MENAALSLGISTATVRNWVKCGHLQTFNKSGSFVFSKNDIERAKTRILNGNLKKLDARANKTNAKRYFIPAEYAQDGVGFLELDRIVNFIKTNNVDLSCALFLVGLNWLKKEKILLRVSMRDIIGGNDLFSVNKQIKEEINLWLSELDKGKITDNLSFLLDCDIPNHRDVLGFLYQSLLIEGKKSQSGSYYTPSKIVDEIVTEHVERDSKVLDPCCGTGQFLLAFSDVVENPLNIYGIDFDEIAVKIARLNLLAKFRNRNFVPNVFYKNALFDVGNFDLFSANSDNIKNFDIIATNPPWGVDFSKKDIEKLKKIYSEITSFESFSYFLKKSMDLLRNDGMISFILPESILNVKAHKDIRAIILKNAKIEKIVYLNRVFKNVFTPVIRIDFKKNRDNNLENEVEIKKENQGYRIAQSRWANNQNFIFDIHSSGRDNEIIDKIYQINHTTLKGKADWALGIVTGNNREFIITYPGEGFEPIYKGKSVERFILGNPLDYIRFVPEKFQQVAPIEKYRAKEKLIYKFISKNLVFAYDNKQRLTLNSANILIPKIPNYSIKVIAALFNSSLYQFIFQKKFSSIKVLRNHIEQLPLPLWDQETFSEIIELTDKTIENRNNFQKLDNYIIDRYNLSTEEKEYVVKFQ
ncbi:MAG: N-6 DNA methylase [Minisyncoccales bacterium]